ncbi:AMP-binding protein [Actinomadura sp. 3N407]|uniref:AMP-binding protein n=1 Tax=Actinomadura sp. 3N407 TaxID=3457423 RepID=UPI003FCD08AB
MSAGRSALGPDRGGRTDAASEPVPIGRLLTDLATAWPERPMVTCAGRTYSRAWLESRANRLARHYERLGVGEGALVTIALRNGVEFIAAAFATWKLGAVPQPVSHRLPGHELTTIIDLADPALLVGAPGGRRGDRPSLPEGFTPDPSLPDTPVEPVRVAPAWRAMTSGGSTGRPKLIMAGEPGLARPEAGLLFGMRENGVQLVPGPLYHNGPFTMAALGAGLGHHLVILERFDAVVALEAIQAHRVDWMNLVPTMMRRIWRVLQDHPDRYDLGSLNKVWHTAAPCPAWLKEAWIGLVGPDALMETYGSTEGQASTVISGREWLAHRGSVGRPFSGRMKVFDEAGVELPPGEHGEIYMRRPAGAPPTYRYVGAEPRERGGWESVGDLGWMDEDGYVYLDDRRTDLILSGGVNVYPAEIEGHLTAHPSVDTCAVVGLPDEDLGQRVHAVVYATAEVTGDELRAFLAKRVVAYKVPRSFRFTGEPVRGDDGKARRAAIAEHERRLMQGESGHAGGGVATGALPPLHTARQESE